MELKMILPDRYRPRDYLRVYRWAKENPACVLIMTGRSRREMTGREWLQWFRSQANTWINQRGQQCFPSH